MMVRSVFLAIRADGDMRVLKNRPSPMWGEFVVRLNVRLPDPWPMETVDVDIPNGDTPAVGVEAMRALPVGGTT